jgi:DNA-binding Lrp family transcriptional regulator
MNSKLKKLLFEVSKNSRNSTKKICRVIKSSQQSCSYLINSLKKKKKITNFTTVVDVARLGLINVIVGFDFINFKPNNIKDALKELIENPNIIMIEENKEGIDLIIEYCTHNLSAFNKINMEIIHKYSNVLKIKFIMPVIVKHEFLKNYFFPKINDYKDTVLCGDREVISLNESEKKILTYLVNNPDISYVQIYSKTNILPKTISNIKRNLEKKSIIKGYSCVLDYGKLDILRHYIFISFLNVDLDIITQFIEFSKNHKNIVEVVKIIGEYHVFVIIEELTSKDILKEIRANFVIDKYMVAKSEFIYKKRYLPI